MVSVNIRCVFIMYLGQCKRSSCRRPRVFSPRTGQLQEYCSIKCKNIDTTRAGNIHVYVHCVSEKNVTLFIFVITLSYVVQFCQFLAETYPGEFETNHIYEVCYKNVPYQFTFHIDIVRCRPILPIPQ